MDCLAALAFAGSQDPQAPEPQNSQVIQIQPVKNSLEGILKLESHWGGTLPCCPDEWQGGGVCPPGQRLFSNCNGPGCNNCGTFTCVPDNELCLQ